MSDPDQCGLETILSFVPEDQRKEVIEYIDLIMRDESYLCDIDYSFLGFISDYIQYAALLKRKVWVLEHPAPWDTTKPKPLTVYDLGCATALQHLVFDPSIHYVGIDVGTGPEPKFFRPNCTFVRGRLPDIVDQLDIDPESAIGIANMSLYYWGQPDEWAAFDRVFRRKFVL